MSPKRALNQLVFAIVLPMLVAPLLASAVPARKVRSPSTATAQVKSNTSIIALPLNPIVRAAQRVCAGRTPTGLGYTLLRSASGAKPAKGDVVLVNYIGYLAKTGAVFDQGMQATLTVDGVIPGFSQGLQMLTRTGVARFCIPAALGYRARATGPIPANSDLVFQVELVDFKPADDAPDTTRTPADDPPAPKSDVPHS